MHERPKQTPTETVSFEKSFNFLKKKGFGRRRKRGLTTPFFPHVLPTRVIFDTHTHHVKDM